MESNFSFSVSSKNFSYFIRYQLCIFAQIKLEQILSEIEIDTGRISSCQYYGILMYSDFKSHNVKNILIRKWKEYKDSFFLSKTVGRKKPIIFTITLLNFNIPLMFFF